MQCSARAANHAAGKSIAAAAAAATAHRLIHYRRRRRRQPLNVTCNGSGRRSTLVAAAAAAVKSQARPLEAIDLRLSARSQPASRPLIISTPTGRSNCLFAFWWRRRLGWKCRQSECDFQGSGNDRMAILAGPFWSWSFGLSPEDIGLNARRRTGDLPVRLCEWKTRLASQSDRAHTHTHTIRSKPIRRRVAAHLLLLLLLLDRQREGVDTRILSRSLGAAHKRPRSPRGKAETKSSERRQRSAAAASANEDERGCGGSTPVAQWPIGKKEFAHSARQRQSLIFIEWRARAARWQRYRVCAHTPSDRLRTLAADSRTEARR